MLPAWTHIPPVTFTGSPCWLYTLTPILNSSNQEHVVEWSTFTTSLGWLIKPGPATGDRTRQFCSAVESPALISLRIFSVRVPPCVPASDRIRIGSPRMGLGRQCQQGVLQFPFRLLGRRSQAHTKVLKDTRSIRVVFPSSLLFKRARSFH